MADPTKYFGCELGAQATFNDTTERYIVNGAHDQNRMRELLDGFIDRFVLCQSCKNPETELIVSRDGYITSDCKACGYHGDIDMRHKLTTFISKNPPKKAGKKGKRGAAGADSIAGQPGQVEGVEDEDDDDDELTRKIREGAEKVMTEEEAARLIAEREKEDDWADEDTSPEAVAKRMAALGVSADSSLLAGGLDDDDDDASTGPYGEFAAWVTEQKEQAGGDLSAAELYKEADARGVTKKPHRLLPVLFPALFDDKVTAELPKYLPVLAKVSERFRVTFCRSSEKTRSSRTGGCVTVVTLADVFTLRSKSRSSTRLKRRPRRSAAGSKSSSRRTRTRSSLCPRCS